MQYSFKALALLALAGVTVATDFPECAKGCIDPLITTVGCSGPTDYKCLCANAQTLTVSAATCIVGKCSDIAQVQKDAEAFCKEVAAGEHAAPAPATSAAPAPISSAAPKPTTSAEPETTSEEPLPSTSLTPYPTSSPVVSTVVGTAAPTGAVPTSSLPPFQGGAAQAAAGAGSIFVAGLAVLAAF